MTRADEPRTSRARRWSAWSAFAVAATLTAAMIWLSIRAPSDPAVATAALALMSMSSAVVGLVIALRRPGNRVGWILLAHASLVALATAATAYAYHDQVAGAGSLPGSRWAALVANNFVLYFAGLVALAFVFPDGRVIPTPRWRRRTRIAAGLIVATALTGLLAEDEFDPPLQSVQSPLPAIPVLEWLQGPLLLGLVWSLCAGAWAMRTRMRTARGAVRQQLLWTAYAALGIPLTVVLCISDLLLVDGEGTGALTTVPFVLTLLGVPVTVGIAILRHQLFDIEVVINRTLVYGALTVCVVGGYVALVAGLDALLDTRGLAGVIAAGSVAVAVQPLRERLQRRVDRLLYGYRSDPYEAIRRLGERLHATLEPDEVLRTIVESVAEALRLPFVAIEVGRESATEVAASTGEPGRARFERLPLLYQGELVAELVIGVPPGRELSVADQRLLDDLAVHAGVAVHAVRLTSDLQHSRERLVTAREEERRRVRRDLHDGLGPTLAAAVLALDASRQAVSEDPAHADELLVSLRGQMQDAIADVRRLVYDLRPPALDELGLMGALREQAARLCSANGGLRVSVHGHDALPPLPAAVEVAAYRIAMEAMNNVTRHACARHCTVGVHLDGALEVEIADDGGGIPSAAPAGVGLQSMRERASELGGRLEVAAAPHGGTVVRAHLPAGVP